MRTVNIARKAIRKLTGHTRANLFVVGTRKCGTTSMYHYLGQFDDVFMSKTKELYFFDDFHQRSIQWDENNKTDYTSYNKHFDFGYQWTGECTATYTKKPPCFEKLHAYNPNAKIIMLMRSPAKRLFSEWNSGKKILFSKKVEKTIARQNPRELYNIPVIQILKLFGAANFMPIKSEQFFATPQTVMDEIAEFLNIKKTKFIFEGTPENEFKAFNAKSYRMILSPSTFERLSGHYADSYHGIRKIARLGL